MSLIHTNSKTCEIYQDEVQVLHNLGNLYSSAAVYKTINVLTDTLNNHKEQLKECTKLTVTDGHIYGH